MKEKPKARKFAKVRLVLANGLDVEEHWYQVESTQLIYDQIQVGDFVHLASNGQFNAVTVGRVMALKDVKAIKKLGIDTLVAERFPRVIGIDKIDALNFIDGLEVS